ncbi:hypothetical protein PISL3812_09954 [Talaromyces islandicus]|uniref:Uncharacterized protein n=1 Tax=Talaromyces islandicus TaxID=28573 RepID=A0A0U1MBG6_TALIS|nr:hypothetical protein PISL3812_09954 [Talaromyces islandicus]
MTSDEAGGPHGNGSSMIDLLRTFFISLTGTASPPPGSYTWAESGTHARPVDNSLALCGSTPSLIGVNEGCSDDSDQCISDSDTVIMTTRDFWDTVNGKDSDAPVVQVEAPSRPSTSVVYEESTSLHSSRRPSTDCLPLENEDSETSEGVHRGMEETCSKALERCSNSAVAEKQEVTIARTGESDGPYGRYCLFTILQDEKEKGQSGVSQVKGTKNDSVSGSHSMTSDAIAPETTDKTDNSAPKDLSSGANYVRSKKRKPPHDSVSPRQSKRLAGRRTTSLLKKNTSTA